MVQSTQTTVLEGTAASSTSVRPIWDGDVSQNHTVAADGGLVQDFPPQRYAIALYDYQSEYPEDLDLRRGDVITILGTEKSGWWDGLIGSRRGWFPSNYCAAPNIGRNDSPVITTLFGKEESDFGWLGGPDTWEAVLSAHPLIHQLDSIVRADKTGEVSSSDRTRYPEIHGPRHEWRVRRTSLTTPQTENEFFSEGELSFVGVHNASGNATPIGDLAVTSRVIALDLSFRILRAYAQTQSRHKRTHGTKGSRDDSERSSSASSPLSSTRSKDTDITIPRITKRKLGKINEDDEDSNKEDEDLPKKKPSATDATIKLFACPFAKYDPERYSERNTREREYRSCSSCLLRDIARLKQHLYRVHRRPDHYCPSCFEAFKTQAILDEHVRARSCELAGPLYVEKMTKDQFNQIKRRHRGETPSQNWFSIFRILFPEAALPTSPYAGDGDTDQTALRHFVHYFRTFGPEQFFNLMRDRQGAVQRLESSTQAIVDEAFEITAPELLRQLQSHTTSEVDQPSPEQRTYHSALSAAEVVFDTLQQESSQIARSRRQSTEPAHQASLDQWLQTWSSENVGPTAGFPEVFDFDTTFDPLTIEDSFDAYGRWFD